MLKVTSLWRSVSMPVLIIFHETCCNGVPFLFLETESWWKGQGSGVVVMYKTAKPDEISFLCKRNPICGTQLWAIKVWVLFFLIMLATLMVIKSAQDSIFCIDIYLTHTDANRLFRIYLFVCIPETSQAKNVDTNIPRNTRCKYPGFNMFAVVNWSIFHEYRLSTEPADPPCIK